MLMSPVQLSALQVRLLLCKPAEQGRLSHGEVCSKWACGCVGVCVGKDLTELKPCPEHAGLLCNIDRCDSADFDIAIPTALDERYKVMM